MIHRARARPSFAKGTVSVLPKKLDGVARLHLGHGVRDRDLDAAIDRGAASLADLAAQCGAGTGRGACIDDLTDKLAASVTCAGHGGSHGRDGGGARARAPITLRGRDRTA